MPRLWGSRFKGEFGELSKKFTFSVHYDSKLALYDCVGSIAHAEMLGAKKFIPQKDAAAIVKGLKKINSRDVSWVREHFAVGPQVFFKV